MNIDTIIDKCNGMDIVATATNLTEQAIRLWAKNGIPEKHWTTLIELSKIKNTNVSSDDIFNANQNINTDLL